jgi:hypothetical protein
VLATIRTYFGGTYMMCLVPAAEMSASLSLKGPRNSSLDSAPHNLSMRLMDDGTLVYKTLRVVVKQSSSNVMVVMSPSSTSPAKA